MNNIFGYLSDKMSIRNAQLRDDISKRILENKKKEQDEQKRVFERNKLISQLKEVLSYLSDQELQVKVSIETMLRTIKAQFNEFLTNSMADVLSNVSGVPSSFQIPVSFSEHLSDVKPKLEELSKQKSSIEQLIHNVSPSVSTALSEFEQRIISILNVKSFFESQTVASVQRMINVCSSMRECLNILGIYSEEIKREMSGEIKKRAKKLADFDIDSQRLRSNSDALNQLSQELADFKQKIDEIIKSFSEKYTVESLFSESADFSLFFEFMRSFDDEIQKVTANFSTTKSILVTFVNDEFYFRKNFVDKVYYDDCQEYVGSSSEQRDYDDFHRYYTEPAGATRQRLEAILQTI